MSRVLVTGVTGQAGFYLAQHCLEAGDTVYGMVRWDSSAQARREHLAGQLPGLRIVNGDLCDQGSLVRAIEEAAGISGGLDIVYNLAALAASNQSWQQPAMMAEINAVGVLNMLEAIRHTGLGTRFVQASTSEQYGRMNEQPQSERTPFGSLNVYGVAKTFAHQATINYRDSFGMHASTALMHNYVSPRRNAHFVDRKITRAAARIYHGLDTELRLGNTDASRDWGWGPEYMQAWRLIAEHDEPSDYIIATGQTHTVQELLESAFEMVGLNWADWVVRDEAFMRPTDVAVLHGDPSYIAKTLGWRAEIGFEEIVQRLIAIDLETARVDAAAIA